jgi:sialate O-acetylesterase
MFFDVVVDHDQPNSVLCQAQKPIPAGMNLCYGYGYNPYCNLVDEQDMAVLVFGPIPLAPAATRANR